MAYARPYVNGEITHDLRHKGLLISVPGRRAEICQASAVRAVGILNGRHTRWCEPAPCSPTTCFLERRGSSRRAAHLDNPSQYEQKTS